MIIITHHFLLLHRMRTAQIDMAARVIPASVNPATSEDQSSMTGTPEANTESDECYSHMNVYVSVESDRCVSPGVGRMVGVWPTSDFQLYSSLQSLQMALDRSDNLALTLMTYSWCKISFSSGRAE